MLKKLFQRKKPDKDNLENIQNLDIDLSGFKELSKTDIQTFDELLEQFAALSFEKQLNFGELIGSNNWQFDMNQGEISFGDNLIFPVQVIGSLSFNDNSWMWGWANAQSGIPDNLLIQSNELKKFGERLYLEKLTEGHYSVEEGFEHKIGMISCGYFSCDSYYCANYGQGTLVVTIQSDKIQRINKNKAERILTTFPKFISSVDVNHKEALKNYLIDCGGKIEMSDLEIKGVLDGKLIIATFDSQNRLKNLEGKM